MKLNQISPLDFDALEPYFGDTELLAVVEDSFGAGCVGQRVAAILAEHGRSPKRLLLINLRKTYLSEGTVAQLEHAAGLDAPGIVETVQEAMK